ncbi:hypothetical protein AMTRI_Chr03g147860 [Amborella trichopoda]
MSFVSSSLFLSVFFCPNLRRDAGSLIWYDFPHIGSNRCFDWAQGPTYNCQSSREASRKSSGARAECMGSSPRCIANVSSKSGPKDLPIIARAAGRLAGRAGGHVQSARRHLQDVLQMSQASQITSSSSSISTLSKDSTACLETKDGASTSTTSSTSLTISIHNFTTSASWGAMGSLLITSNFSQNLLVR